MGSGTPLTSIAARPESQPVWLNSTSALPLLESADETVFDHSTFSQNQARLLQHKVADLFFAEVVWYAKAKRWISDQHFSIDATLIESWASLKSFKNADLICVLSVPIAATVPAGLSRASAIAV
jgi:hypothetical protein